MPGYFVMQCKPSKTIEVRNKLQAEFGEHSVVAPSYRSIIRVGRVRKRVETEKPVLGGIVFASAEAKASCGCRERPSDPLRAVPMLVHEIDANGDRHHAMVDGDELQPLLDYAEERNAVFFARKLGKSSPPSAESVPEVVAGDRVRLMGALSGMVGMVTAVDARGEASVKLDASGGLFGDAVTVPVAMLRRVEG